VYREKRLKWHQTFGSEPYIVVLIENLSKCKN